MPVGQIKFKGGLGSTAPIGKALPSTGAALLTRGAAKMGLGGNPAAAGEMPPDPELGKILRGAGLASKAPRKTSKGRQNVPVKRSGTVGPQAKRGGNGKRKA
jgi:hypothetical protein